MYTCIAENADYAIKTSKDNATGLLVRKKDNYYCYLSEEDTCMLIEHIDELDFITVCKSFTFTNPLTERV